MMKTGENQQFVSDTHYQGAQKMTLQGFTQDQLRIQLLKAWQPQQTKGTYYGTVRRNSRNVSLFQYDKMNDSFKQKTAKYLPNHTAFKVVFYFNKDTDTITRTSRKGYREKKNRYYFDSYDWQMNSKTEVRYVNELASMMKLIKLIEDPKTGFAGQYNLAQIWANIGDREINVRNYINGKCTDRHQANFEVHEINGVKNTLLTSVDNPNSVKSLFLLNNLAA